MILNPAPEYNAFQIDYGRMILRTNERIYRDKSLIKENSPTNQNFS